MFNPSGLTPPITYISPNILELEHLFRSAREPTIEDGREIPALTSSDEWFSGIDELGLRASISSDEFARLGGQDGAFLSKNGIIQMSVQLLPFFQHLIVKCGDKGKHRFFCFLVVVLVSIADL